MHLSISSFPYFTWWSEGDLNPWPSACKADALPSELPPLIAFLTLSLVDRDLRLLLRKEVIQAHLPVHLPCYDFAPLASSTLKRLAPFGYFFPFQVSPTRVA